MKKEVSPALMENKLSTETINHSVDAFFFFDENWCELRFTMVADATMAKRVGPGSSSYHIRVHRVAGSVTRFDRQTHKTHTRTVEGWTVLG